MQAKIQCESCRELLADEDNRKLADLVDKIHPECSCEKFSVGKGSPGPVADEEHLVRLVASPRDFCPDRRILLEQPFRKVYQNGLSVCRSLASDDDFAALTVEALTHEDGKPLRTLVNVSEVKAGDIRNMMNEHGAKPFCIYDQTVSRLDADQVPIPTHASIFQRLPAPGSVTRRERERLQRDLAGKLRDKFIEGACDIGAFRGGLLSALNQRAESGEFRRPPKP